MATSSRSGATSFRADFRAAGGYELGSCLGGAQTQSTGRCFVGRVATGDLKTRAYGSQPKQGGMVTGTASAVVPVALENGVDRMDLLRQLIRLVSGGSAEAGSRTGVQPP